ncbi:acyl carrier protein phosphodiesterase [Winogradskyella immobilis]|uniref:Acyl carrier protein phosphodiesterase n=1 Tax=Winogradskyella immobilis TaxID=2816852 RepID=A0ABS8ENR2_9FLAO|nr:acyl carrier protein phosphodiesterase [Winogradskyella immobilis]MCC1484205.1 acyl carrier protein phosphodiesterase [Winogradskyella immobilis]MCG0016297.1 acyl carrier protein phosphodiesterase [Winogradskyella immobilis]
MNFLAHIYLSGDNELLTIGNFSADGVRGNKYKEFPKSIQAGIILHRHIDTFTDAHPITKQSTKRLHKNYSHYSGVIVDIFYDHFLAKNWEDYSDINLSVYISNFYKSLTDNFLVLPERFKKLTPVMIEGNWLLSYASIDGIERVLNGMNKRTKGRSKMNEAIHELVVYYDDFEKEFTQFFKELIVFSNQKRIEIEKEFNL